MKMELQSKSFSSTKNIHHFEHTLSKLLAIVEKRKRRIQGVLNGFCVCVESPEATGILAENCGFFGTLFPSAFNVQQGTEIIRERQFHRRKSCGKHGSPRKLLVIPDSDSDEDATAYFQRELRPHFELDYSGFKPKLYLNLTEAFFLSYAMDVLDIYSMEGYQLSGETLWNTFQHFDWEFPEKYAVYHYYRARNWVVRCGLKFGGDFLLYKEGPSFYHASYLVVIINSSINQEDSLELRRLCRLCETIAKDLLLCRVITNIGAIRNSTKFIEQCQIHEIRLTRWQPTHEVTVSTAN